MQVPASPSVGLQIASAELGARWTAALSAGGCRVITTSDTGVVDVLLVEPQSAAIGLAASTLSGEPAVVLITAADGETSDLPAAALAWLPQTASDRELLQTVRLAAQIVRLRHQRDQSREARADLLRLALTDPLTGLPNRRAWDEELRAQIAACQADGQPLFVAILDLDEFKQVNDQLGFAAGDAVLVVVSKALSGQLRAGDFVARVGGDEFGLLLGGVSAEQAKAVADRVRKGVADSLVSCSSVPVTASVGLSRFGGGNAQGESGNPSEVFARADVALRKAKRTGRNQMVTDFDEP